MKGEWAAEEGVGGGTGDVRQHDGALAATPANVSNTFLQAQTPHQEELFTLFK